MLGLTQRAPRFSLTLTLSRGEKELHIARYESLQLSYEVSSSTFYLAMRSSFSLRERVRVRENIKHPKR